MSMFKSPQVWQGRDDCEDGEAGRRWHHAINAPSETADFSVLGFSCDLGVANNKGRTGAAKGPDVIRGALANHAWHSALTACDLGTVVASDELVTAQRTYADKIAAGLSESAHVFGLGGGHEIAWGSYLGLFDSLESKRDRIGIVNFDAHFDLRKPSPETSSGTPFRQIAEHRYEQNLSFDYACLGVARTANTQALFDYAHHTNTLYLEDKFCEIRRAQHLLLPMLERIDHLYVTICLDAFPAALAPGVSAPSALGISPEFVINMLEWLQQQQHTCNYQWRLTDVAEMNPTYDIDQRTAKLAARLISEITYGYSTSGAVT